MSRIDYAKISPYSQDTKQPVPEQPASAEQQDSDIVEPLLYNTKPAAQLLGIGKTGLFQLIDEGRLQSVKVFSRRMISRQAINTFINELSQEAR